jgi:hypothetical protein
MKSNGALLRRSVNKAVPALVGAVAMVSFAPSALAAQQQSAENHQIAAQCVETVANPSRPFPNPETITTTAHRTLGCRNANVEVFIYEDRVWWPDEQEAYASLYYAVGDLTATGDGATPPTGEDHYALLKINGQEVARSAPVD